MTYKELERANSLKFEMDRLTRQIEQINDFAEGRPMEINFFCNHDHLRCEIPVPDELREIIMDLIETNLSRKRWAALHEFDAIGNKETEKGEEA